MRRLRSWKPIRSTRFFQRRSWTRFTTSGKFGIFWYHRISFWFDFWQDDVFKVEENASRILSLLSPNILLQNLWKYHPRKYLKRGCYTWCNFLCCFALVNWLFVTSYHHMSTNKAFILPQGYTSYAYFPITFSFSEPQGKPPIY